MFQFSQSEIQSTASSLFSAYASFAAMMMMIRSMTNDVLPESVRRHIQSFINYFLTPIPSSTTIVIHDQCGMSRNEVYDAAEVYLCTKISRTTERFKVNKTVKQKKIQLSIEKNEEISDVFQGFQLRWKFVTVEPNKNSSYNFGEKRFYELSFNKNYKDRVVDEYLPYILAKSKEIKDESKVVKLYTTDGCSYEEEDGGGGVWGSINLDHPATFEKLAMDPKMKQAVVDDLDRFVRRKDYYKKVGKAWKRGYLLYGPPGTGKSSLIAAMANYLNFDVYDVELTNLYSNSELRRILVSTTNKSIIVIEDIDCSVQMQDRKQNIYQKASDTKLTLSGLLNFIDGLWSSCGDERIIIFTTNHKDKLDPALLRPGRMDMHIHMSYCTFEGFKLLASNYLGVGDEHRLYKEIKEIMENVQVTPAEVAEELMKNENVDIAFLGLTEFLKQKKVEVDEAKCAIEKETNDVEEEEQDVIEEETEKKESHQCELSQVKAISNILWEDAKKRRFRSRRGGTSGRSFLFRRKGYLIH